MNTPRPPLHVPTSDEIRAQMAIIREELTALRRLFNAAKAWRQTQQPRQAYRETEGALRPGGGGVS